MDKSDFVNLHVHSDFSTLDGVARTDELAKTAKRCGQVACALTDHGSLSGAVSFAKECKAQGVKPILGYEAYLAFGEQPGAHLVKEKTDASRETNKKYNHLTVLTKSRAGWDNLSKLASIASLDGFYYKPRIDVDLLRKHREGLIILSGCLSGPVSLPLLKGDYSEARRVAALYKEIFGDDYYGEIQPNSLADQRTVNAGWLKLSKDLGIKLVASADLHYISPEDHPVQEARICIASGKGLHSKDRLAMEPDFYFRSTEQMYDYFSAMPEVVLASREIADKVEKFSILSEGKYFLPKFEAPDGTPSRDYLRRLASDGLIRRYGQDYRKHTDRLEYELGVIEKLGFVDYFLIVADLIAWARANGCPVGPGRGSAAGSIVAYSIGITDIDPIRFGLYFERFLNPDRISMPDIDIDFCETNRHKVVEYVRRKYGDDNVCQIITFGTMKVKMALKDVARVLDDPSGKPLISLDDINEITRLVPESPTIDFEKAFAAEPKLKDYAEGKFGDEYVTLFQLAQKLEGINRHTSTHAAGIVISDIPLINRIPLVRDNKTGAITTQFTMTEVEDVGLLKMDFLGLKTLTVIEECLNLIHRTTGVLVDMDQIPLNDPRTYALLQCGEAKGVFQLESDGMQKVLVNLKPDRIEDIVALVALYRPGPIEAGMIDSFLSRKHGLEPVVYDHPVCESFMAETYGTLVYQETIMALAHKLAGFTLAQSDGIRKAIGKKKLDEMMKYKNKFVEGCTASGLSVEKSTNLWDQIEKFAGYSFNKAHSAAYGVIAYRTAWLKANYPIQYMAAYLSSIRGDSEKLPIFVEEARAMGIRIVPPDINESGVGFDVRRDADGLYILYGLEALAGCGETAIANVLDVRRRIGKFRSIYHFCENVDTRVVNHKVITTLAQAGAFSCTGANRAQAIKAVDAALEMAAGGKKRGLNQLMIFSASPEEMARLDKDLLPKVPELSPGAIVEAEKAAFGFFLTQHPLGEFKLELESVATARSGDLSNTVGTNVLIAGRLSAMRIINDRKGNEMAFFEVEDLSGITPCVAFSSTWKDIRGTIGMDQKVVVLGAVDNSRDKLSLRAIAASPLDKVSAKFKSLIEIDLLKGPDLSDTLKTLRGLCEPQGRFQIVYRVRDEETGLIQGPLPLGRLSDWTRSREKILNVLPASATIKIGTNLSSLKE